MRALCLGERLEPVGDFVEAFFARRTGHAGIHVGIFVGFTSDRSRKVQLGLAHGQAGGGIAAFFQEFEMAMGVARLTFRGGAEYSCDVVLAFDISLLSEIEIAAIGL